MYTFKPCATQSSQRYYFLITLPPFKRLLKINPILIELICCLSQKHSSKPNYFFHGGKKTNQMTFYCLLTAKLWSFCLKRTQSSNLNPNLIHLKIKSYQHISPIQSSRLKLHPPITLQLEETTIFVRPIRGHCAFADSAVAVELF